MDLQSKVSAICCFHAVIRANKDEFVLKKRLTQLITRIVIFLIFLKTALHRWKNKNRTLFPIRLRNRLISPGLELFSIHTEKSCNISYYGQFSTYNEIITIKSLIEPTFRTPGANNMKLIL